MVLQRYRSEHSVVNFRDCRRIRTMVPVPEQMHLYLESCDGGAWRSLLASGWRRCRSGHCSRLQCCMSWNVHEGQGGKVRQSRVRMTMGTGVRTGLVGSSSSASSHHARGQAGCSVPDIVGWTALLTAQWSRLSSGIEQKEPATKTCYPLLLLGN